MKNNNLVIWKDVPVIILLPTYYNSRGKKRKMKLRKFYGDVPIAYLNKETGKLEECFNHRGNAYANRNARRYFKKIK
jgi:hypothetical protein